MFDLSDFSLHRYKGWFIWSWRQVSHPNQWTFQPTSPSAASEEQLASAATAGVAGASTTGATTGASEELATTSTAGATGVAVTELRLIFTQIQFFAVIFV